MRLTAEDRARLNREAAEHARWVRRRRRVERLGYCVGWLLFLAGFALLVLAVQSTVNWMVGR